MGEFLTPQGTLAWIASVLFSCGVFLLLGRPQPLFQLVGLQLLLAGTALVLQLLGDPFTHSAILIPFVAVGVGWMGLQQIRQEAER